jgi:hypothetical protein
MLAGGQSQLNKKPQQEVHLIINLDTLVLTNHQLKLALRIQLDNWNNYHLLRLSSLSHLM